MGMSRAHRELGPLGRFWGHLDEDITPDECWLWRGYFDAHGYGIIRIAGKRWRAHRFAYELLVGPMPEGTELDHLCRVHGCVNPGHLEPVTHAENIRRGLWGSFHSSKTHCPQGHPYNEENTYYYAKRNNRECRVCRRLRINAMRRRIG